MMVSAAARSKSRPLSYLISLSARHRHALARGAVRDIADHAVAGLEAGDAGADDLDHAGEFAAGRERQRRLFLVAALDDERVVEVQADRLHPRDDLAGAGDGFGKVGEHEVIGGAESGTEDGFHGVQSMSLRIGAAF